ncbi:monooxygenase family protein, partial [Microbacterium sp.]|uniref:monooxygenase family protein n=1 Tax=Microbacterium sp. TaxID=51671 RepID=UPI003F989CCC
MRSKPERLTHDYDGELVVFLIGMRINRWSHVRDWWPTFRAMPPMITELMSDPDSGAVGYRLFGL